MLNNRKNKAKSMMLIVMVLLFMSIIHISFAQTGAQLTNVSTSQKSAASPQYNNGTKGAIHTVNLNAEQQDNKWKAYVGNVSSTFVLDDANDYSIYQWTISSFTGQIYITRSNGITWSNVKNASETNKTEEDTALGHTSTSDDSINKTFASRVHRSFTVAGNTIVANSSYSTVTWQNDANHQLNVSAPWQEVLLGDGNQLIYTAFVENDKVGYRADGTTYDFQAIVADNATTGSTAVRYYFYLELSSS